MHIIELLQLGFHSFPGTLSAFSHHRGFDLGQPRFGCLMCFNGAFARVRSLFFLSMRNPTLSLWVYCQNTQSGSQWFTRLDDALPWSSLKSLAPVAAVMMLKRGIAGA